LKKRMQGPGCGSVAIIGSLLGSTRILFGSGRRLRHRHAAAPGREVATAVTYLNILVLRGDKTPTGVTDTGSPGGVGHPGDSTPSGRFKNK
jgi:hypothetical protein